MEKTKKMVLWADLALLGAALLWGTSFVAMKAAVEGIPPFFLVGIRFLISAVILSPCLYFRPWSRKDIRGGVVVGFFLLMGFVSQAVGLQYTSSSSQAILTATYVVLTPLLSWIVWRIYPGTKAFVAGVICFMGIAMVGSSGGFLGSMNTGDWFSLAGAFFFAGHLIAIERYAPHQDVLVLLFFQIFFAGIVGFVLGLLFETWPVAASFKAWSSVGYSVVFCTIVAFFCQNWGQQYTSSSHAALLLSLESFFGAIAGVVLLKEILTPIMIVGGVLILLAVFICELGPIMLLERKKLKASL